MRRIAWIVPASLAGLALAMAFALTVARDRKPSRALEVAAPGILRAGSGAPPEIAALNEQLAQLAALRAGAVYGAGLERVVRNPVPSLRASLGEQWRELGTPIGHVLVRPSGNPTGRVEVGMVAVANHGPARLSVLTSAGQSYSQIIAPGAFELVNVGPLVAPPGRGIGLTLRTLKPHDNAVGPKLLLSPIQGEYLAPGQWTTVMPALREPGPAGSRGSYLRSGTVTRFAMAPGLRGRCMIALRGAAIGAVMRVTAAVGGESRSAIVGDTPEVVYIGPFKRPRAVVSITAGSPANEASLFISDMRFIPAPSGI